MRFSRLLGAVVFTCVVVLSACGQDDSSNGSLDASDNDASASSPDAASADAALPVPADLSSPAMTDGGGASAAAGALHFGGTNQSVIVNVVNGGSETSFTVELWMRTMSSTAGLFEVYGAGADRMLSLNAGKVCWYVYGPGTQICSTATTYADGAWHHVAGTLGVVSGMRLYIDGTLAASGTKTSSTFTNDTSFQWGAGHTGFSSAVSYVNGDIDDVRVWSVERTATEVAANYLVPMDPSTPGLLGYWKLDETGTGNVAIDAVGAHNATLFNFAFSPSPWVAGKL